MKKRILALLLAGLLTASLASCISSSVNRPNDTSDDSGTESNQTRDTTDDQSDTSDTTDNNTVTWEDTDDTVYVITNNLTLMPVEDTDKSIKAELMTELHRVKISSDDKRSIVEKDGKQYYATNTYLNASDLLGKKFEKVANVKMFAVDGVKVRPYASLDNSFSEALTSLKKGDEVTVVAKGDANEMSWYKIKYTDPADSTKTYEGFVSAKYLTADPDKDFRDFFKDCEEFTMYVATGTLNLRTTPYVDVGNNNAGVLYRDDAVIVVAKGESEDFEDWYYIKLANPKEPGIPQTYSYYYVNKNYLAENKSTENMTLAELLATYTTFTEGVKNLFVAADSLNVRTSPDVSNSDNIVNPGFVKKDTVKVVATGLVDGKQWSIIERTEGTGDDAKTAYRFVRSIYLTTDPNGEAMASLEALLADNPGFTKLDQEKTYYATEATYGFTSLGTSTPTSADKAIDLAKDAKVTVVAEGTKFGYSFYIIEAENEALYFVYADMFSNTVAVG